MANTFTFTSKNSGTSGKSRMFSITLDVDTVTSAKTVTLGEINGYFLGVYNDMSAVGASSDLTIMHNNVDLLGGIGSALSTTETYLPALVTASATDFANGLPVGGVVTPTFGGTLTTTTGTLVLFFIGLGM